MNRQDSLAAIVRRERRVHGWSQDQLARAAGLNLRTVQRVERGSACSGETLQALASALNLSTPKLTKAAPDTRQRPRVLGLSSLRSMWIGAVLCLPASIFVVLNVGYYELGLAALEPLVTSTAWNSMVDDHLALPLILGGPAIAFVAVDDHTVPKLYPMTPKLPIASNVTNGRFIQRVSLAVNVASPQTLLKLKKTRDSFLKSRSPAFAAYMMKK